VQPAIPGANDRHEHLIWIRLDTRALEQRGKDVHQRAVGQHHDLIALGVDILVGHRLWRRPRLPAVDRITSFDYNMVCLSPLHAATNT